MCVYRILTLPLTSQQGGGRCDFFFSDLLVVAIDLMICDWVFVSVRLGACAEFWQEEEERIRGFGAMQHFSAGMAELVCGECGMGSSFCCGVCRGREERIIWGGKRLRGMGWMGLVRCVCNGVELRSES